MVLKWFVSIVFIFMIKNPRIVYRHKRALVRCSEGVKCSYFCCNLFWLHVYNIFRQIFYCKPQSHHTWAEKCGQWIFNWWRYMSKFRLKPQRTYYTSHSLSGFDASYHLRIEAGGPQGRAAAAGPDTAHSQIVRIWWRDDHPDPAMVPHSAHPSAWWTSPDTPAAAQHHEGFHYSQNVVMCLQNNFCQPQLLPSENFISPACHFIPTSGLLNHACWGPDKVSHFNIRQSKMLRLSTFQATRIFDCPWTRKLLRGQAASEVYGGCCTSPCLAQPMSQVPSYIITS